MVAVDAGEGKMTHHVAVAEVFSEENATRQWIFGRCEPCPASVAVPLDSDPDRRSRSLIGRSSRRDHNCDLLLKSRNNPNQTLTK